jgi:hypothetical protein
MDYMVNGFFVWSFQFVAEEIQPADNNFIQDFFFGIFASVVDLMAYLLPQTPEDLKIGSIVTGLMNAQSASFANYFILQALSGLTGILILVAIYKLIKILPLT